MRPEGGDVVAAVTKMNVLPFFSRAEQWPFKLPVHVPASLPGSLQAPQPQPRLTFEFNVNILQFLVVNQNVIFSNFFCSGLCDPFISLCMQGVDLIGPFKGSS